MEQAWVASLRSSGQPHHGAADAPLWKRVRLAALRPVEDQRWEQAALAGLPGSRVGGAADASPLVEEEKAYDSRGLPEWQHKRIRAAWESVINGRLWRQRLQYQPNGIWGSVASQDGAEEVNAEGFGLAESSVEAMALTAENLARHGPRHALPGAQFLMCSVKEPPWTPRLGGRGREWTRSRRRIRPVHA
mmetsp:Transcript_86220/g.152684  ORF Transcript_86220/g.152684 Transcript_86220/m.152684 type:complete len:190 (+) Transcript_86220:80-649(+)